MGERVRQVTVPDSAKGDRSFDCRGERLLLMTSINIKNCTVSFLAQFPNAQLPVSILTSRKDFKMLLTVLLTLAQRAFLFFFP